MRGAGVPLVPGRAKLDGCARCTCRIMFAPSNPRLADEDICPYMFLASRLLQNLLIISYLSVQIESSPLAPASHLEHWGPNRMVKLSKVSGIVLIGLLAVVVLTSSGCGKTEVKAAAPPPLPVNTQTVSLAPVPRVDEYVATVKSRRSASIQPQVDGSITRILVKSGDHVRAGQVLITIDPLKQQATVDQQRSTEAQKKATLDYNKHEVERQEQLYGSGVSSKRDYRTCGAGVREFQSRLGSFDGRARHSAASACILQPDGSVRRCRG